MVDPRARSPAALSATTSAWGSPYRTWYPSPTTSPSRTTTAPTIGFGAVCPQPSCARASARRMYCASRASLESESSSDRSVDSGIGCLLATEGVESVNGATGYLSNFAGELEKQKVHRHIREDVGAGKVLRDRDRTSVGGGTRRDRSRGNVGADIGRSIVLVLTEA